MNIYDIPAGAEMDRLVAEKVMGWKIHDFNDGLYVSDIGIGVPWVVTQWRPSNDIAIAWKVLNHLMKGWRHISLFYCETTCEWVCRLNKFRCVEGDARTKAWAETAPLAICRAALKAVG